MSINKVKKMVSGLLALAVVVSSLASAALLSAASASAKGEPDTAASVSHKATPSSKSKSSPSSSKSEDKSSAGAFSTSTDSRSGATKPEDNAAAGLDSRNGALQPEDNGIDSNQATDNRGGATGIEDNGVVSGRQAQGEDSIVHRSAVAEVVKQLNSIADREGGIGAQVRLVAQAQNDSKERAKVAIDAVEKRGKIRTFLFGVDRKELAQLKSEIELTRKNEADIRTAAQKIENSDNKNVLLKQADMLKKEAEKMEAIETAHSKAFSLFGWVKDIFAK